MYLSAFRSVYFIDLPLCLSVILPVSLYVSLSVCMSVFLSSSLFVTIFLPVCLPNWLNACSLSFILTISLYLSLSIWRSLYLSLSIYVSVCLSVCVKLPVLLRYAGLWPVVTSRAEKLPIIKEVDSLQGPVNCFVLTPFQSCDPRVKPPDPASGVASTCHCPSLSKN